MTKTEIQKLIKKLDNDNFSSRFEMYDYLRQLLDDNDKMKKTLEFYADETTYQYELIDHDRVAIEHLHGPFIPPRTAPIVRDVGRLARMRLIDANK